MRSSSTKSLFPYTDNKMFLRLSLHNLHNYTSLKEYAFCNSKSQISNACEAHTQKKRKREENLCLTRSKMNDAIAFCFNKKSINHNKGNMSFIRQSSTIALLFMPPAQFNSTSP